MQKTKKTKQVAMMKKLKFSRFPSFRFCYIPEIRNLEISECFLLLQFSVSQKTQDSKNKKMKVWFNKKKRNFRVFRVFNFALYPKSKTLKSRKVFFYFKFWSLRLHEAEGKLKVFVEFQFNRPYAYHFKGIKTYIKWHLCIHVSVFMT